MSHFYSHSSSGRDESKRGIGIGAIYSIVVFVLYWVCLIKGEAMADNLSVDAWVAMWSANLIVGVIGLWLMIRMSRENYIGSRGLIGWFIFPFIWLFKAAFKRQNKPSKGLTH